MCISGLVLLIKLKYFFGSHATSWKLRNDTLNETIEHMFFYCSFARDCWTKLNFTWDCWWKSGPKGGRRHNSPLSSLPSFAHSREAPTSTWARKGNAET
jgi:hypothetical protein